MIIDLRFGTKSDFYYELADPVNVVTPYFLFMNVSILFYFYKNLVLIIANEQIKKKELSDSVQ